jgi:hypothetical protein
MINCAKCKTPPHKDCIQTPSYYLQATCQIDIDKLTRAAGKHVLKTYPVENTITHLALTSSLDEGFKAEMEKCCISNSKMVKAFGEIVVQATKNETVMSYKKRHNILAES